MDDLISRQAVLDAICHDKCGLSPNRCISGITGECIQIKPIKAIPSAEPKIGHWEWQTNSDLETTLCSLPKIQSEDGQDYVQLADVLETVRRYKPSVDKTQERSEE